MGGPGRGWVGRCFGVLPHGGGIRDAWRAPRDGEAQKPGQKASLKKASLPRALWRARRRPTSPVRGLPT